MIGETIDHKYKLIRLLGEGGMGSVYEAEDTATNRRLAIKIVKNRMPPQGSDRAKRFRREARAASAVNHEHIVQVFDAGTDKATGLLYMVMEYLRGEDLQKHLDLNGPIAPEAVLRIAAQALLGLQKAQEAHIVHRDIKPANLFLAQRRGGEITVKLLDFGIAKIKADPMNVPNSAALTDASGFLGSPLYMSPEQVLNSRDVDQRSDLWSLASTLYCALAGHAPHESAGAVGKLIYTICSTPPRPLQDAAPWVPTEIAEWLHGALQLNREARYASASVMLKALRPLLSNGTDELRETMLLPVSQRRRFRAVPRPAVPLLSTMRRIIVPVDTTGSVAGVESTAQPDTKRSEGAPVMPHDTGPENADDTTTQSHDTANTIVEEEAAPLDTTALNQTTMHDVPKVEVWTPKGEGWASWARPRALAVGATVLFVLGAAAIAWRTTRPETQLQQTAPRPTAPEPAPPPLALPAPPSPPAASVEPPTAIRQVTLIVSPVDVKVRVDGERVENRDGKVELSGVLGSEHQVVLSRAGKEKQESVVLGEDGPTPPRLELLRAKPGTPRKK